MIRPLVATLMLALLPVVAIAQTTPAPVPSPAPFASPEPSAYFPALGNNDPCTSLAAIVTRPSVTSSVCTVRPNHVEIEGGYFNTTFPGTGNTVTYPQTLIRVGTTIPALELQIAPPQIVRSSVAGAASAGSSDAGAGLKYVFGYTPKFSYGGQVFFTAPTGTNGVSANGSTAVYAVNAGYTLSSVFSVATTLQLQSLTNGPQRWSSLVPSLVVTASLPSANGIYAEIARYSDANGPGTPTRTQYLYGVSHGIGPRLLLDASATVSPTTATGTYHGVGFGASYYF